MIAVPIKAALFLSLAFGLLSSSNALATRQVALTFDDLPVHGPLPQGLNRAGVMRQILNALKHANAPEAYGFINAQGVDGKRDHEDALRLWRAAGFPLANHTFSHMDLHKNDTAAFEADVLANERALEELMRDRDWHWFRYPYLREGDTLEKRRRVRAFLAEQKYAIAQITIDFHDYAYNDPYVRCLEKRDLHGIETLKAIYLREAAESLAESEAASQRLYGRNIKHVMLLHVGAFQPMMLPHLFSLLERSGYKLVSLDEAQSDPVYAEDPDVATTNGGSFLDLVALKRNVATTSYDEQTIASLDAMCR